MTSLSAISPLDSSLIAQLVKDLPAMQETPVRFMGQEDPLEKGLAIPCDSAGKESTCIYTTFLFFLSREDPLAFVEELVWWC